MKIVLIYSGGMDSTTLLYQLLAEGHEVRCLSIDYGQRHRRELDGAAEICQTLGVEHRVADLTSVAPLLAGSALVSGDVEVPEGHYEAENMKLTVVPNRNMLMLSVAIAWAVSTKCDAVAYAAHGGDHTIYPDCRPEFIAAMNVAAGLCDWHSVQILAPYQNMDKGLIARIGADLGVPYGKTWSCYKGLDKHCGRCGACTERREAFMLAGAPDPTEYADVSTD
jgi:7-cyano-7-deazaguanine synthase